MIGSKPGAVAALVYLIECGWDIKCVVAARDEAAWLPDPHLYGAAEALGLEVHENQADVRNEQVDLVISYMARSRIGARLRDLGTYALNFHAGPLPEYGGWAFYSVAILEDATEYGCTCHVMDDGFDTGPLVRVRRFPIDARNETALSLERKTQLEMLTLFREVVTDYTKLGRLATTPQEPGAMRYMTRHEFERLKEVSPQASAAEIDRAARAFWYPPYTMAMMSLADGTHVEIIPAIAKESTAQLLHARDLEQSLSWMGLEDAYGRLRHEPRS